MTWRKSLRALGVDAHIVHEHGLREYGYSVGRAGPVAADGEVQDDEKGMIESPFLSGGPLVGRERSVERRIHVEADGGGLPLHRVKMKIVGEAPAGRQAERSGEVRGAAWRARAVERAMDGAWLLADIFHDVDFPALRPADFADVMAQHPKGGPHAFS